MARKAQCLTLEEFAFIFLDFGGWDMLRTNVDSLLVSQEEEAIRGADLTTAPLKVRCSEAGGFLTLQRLVTLFIVQGCPARAWRG